MGRGAKLQLLKSLQTFAPAAPSQGCDVGRRPTGLLDRPLDRRVSFPALVVALPPLARLAVLLLALPPLPLQLVLPRLLPVKRLLREAERDAARHARRVSIVRFGRDGRSLLIVIIVTLLDLRCRPGRPRVGRWGALPQTVLVVHQGAGRVGPVERELGESVLIVTIGNVFLHNGGEFLYGLPVVAEVVPQPADQFRRYDVTRVLRYQLHYENPVISQVIIHKGFDHVIRGGTEFIHSNETSLDKADFLRDHHTRDEPVEETGDGCDGDPDEPEPDEDEDDLVEEVDGERAHDGVRLHVAEHADVEIAHSNAGEATGVGERPSVHQPV